MSEPAKPKHEWIINWFEIEDNTNYLVCPINQYGDNLSLGQPTGIHKGWYVKRLREQCYAALEIPDVEPWLAIIKEKWRQAKAEVANVQAKLQ